MDTEKLDIQKLSRFITVTFFLPLSGPLSLISLPITWREQRLALLPTAGLCTIPLQGTLVHFVQKTLWFFPNLPAFYISRSLIHQFHLPPPLVLTG